MEVLVTPIVPKVVEYEVKIIMSGAEMHALQNEYETERGKGSTLDIYPFPIIINRLLRGIIYQGV